MLDITNKLYASVDLENLNKHELIPKKTFLFMQSKK